MPATGSSSTASAPPLPSSTRRRRNGRLRRAQLHGDPQPIGCGRIGRGDEPINLADAHALRRQRLARADDDAVRGGIDADDEERLAAADAEAAPLADGEVDDPVMTAEHPAVDMDDVARRSAPCGRSFSTRLA